MIIAARYNGPPGSGNGGYSAGLLASHMTGGSDGVEVTLRRPPPLDTDLELRTDGVPIVGDSSLKVGVLRAYDGSDLVAEATTNVVGDDEAVPNVSYDEAVAISASYPGFSSHPFVTCFVCGPARSPGDGLRLFPGRIGDGRTATPFVAPPDVSPVIVWASLDCPGGWTVPIEGRPYVLGRITARVDAVPAPGERCVVMGQVVREEGRKAFVRTTLYSASGQVLALARSTWVALP